MTSKRTLWLLSSTVLLFTDTSLFSQVPPPAPSSQVTTPNIVLIGIPIDYASVEVKTMELYDLENDISETINVAEQHPEVVARLSGLAHQSRKELGDALTNQTGARTREPGRVTVEK